MLPLNQETAVTVCDHHDAAKAEEKPERICWFGPDHARDESRLDRTRLTIGREDGNDVVLPGAAVSRRHAELLKVGDAFVVADAGSRNGLVVDGARVLRARLGAGSVLRLGEWVGVVGHGGALREVAPGLLGSRRLEGALADLRRAARSDLNVIVSGETGTGKELVARALYAWSGLPGRFVAVNCAALTESLLDAELFGHVRGAFTGAIADRDGHLRAADRGLLFLDEVGEMSPRAQSKLLRFLEEQEVTPVGASRSLRVRVRVLAATHRNLWQMVGDGTFRADLLARLEGLVVRLPALKARREDTLPLFLQFVRARLEGIAPALTADLTQALALHDWPGNVRELRQLADRSAALHGNVDPWSLAQVEPRRATITVTATASAPPRPPGPSVGTEELRRALIECHGVVARAARTIGVSKQTFYNLLRRHGIDREAYRGSSPPA